MIRPRPPNGPASQEKKGRHRAEANMRERDTHVDNSQVGRNNGGGFHQSRTGRVVPQDVVSLRVILHRNGFGNRTP